MWGLLEIRSIWYGEEGCLPNKEAFPWSIASDVIDVQRRFQIIQSWSALAEFIPFKFKQGLGEYRFLKTLIDWYLSWCNRRWSDEAWTSKTSSRARMSECGWVMCYHLISALGAWSSSGLSRRQGGGRHTLREMISTHIYQINLKQITRGRLRLG